MNYLYIKEKETKNLNLAIFSITIALSSIGILITIGFTFFNIKFRNVRIIKMSSPNINNIINCSCIVIYFAPIFNAIKGLNIKTNHNLGTTMCQVTCFFL
jgi:gamma-aminobutyric acid type B receptor